MRWSSYASLAVLAAGLGAPAAALATAAATHVSVGPSAIGPHTTVSASFRQPLTTGLTASQKLTEGVRVLGPAGSSCAGSEVALPSARQGSEMHVTLRPSQFGGEWCPGRYEGFVELTIAPRCTSTGTVHACPQYVIAPRTLARFAFRVSAG